MKRDIKHALECLDELEDRQSRRKLFILQKLNGLLKDPSYRQDIAPVRQNFVLALVKCLDAEDHQSDIYIKALNLLRRFIRLPKLSLTEGELDVLLQKFHDFDGSEKAIVTIDSICKLLFSDQQAHGGHKHQGQILKTVLKFLQDNFAVSDTINEGIKKLSDAVWVNIELDDIAARRAYISGHLELLASQSRQIKAYAINRLREEIVLPAEKSQYEVPSPVLIPKILREFYVSCQEVRASLSNENFADILAFTQPLIELFDPEAADDDASDMINCLYEFCDIIYYVCSISQGDLIELINPDNRLSSSLAILLLQGFSKTLLLKTLFILELIVTRLSRPCDRRFCSDTFMDSEKLFHLLLVRTAIDAIQRKDKDALSELLSKHSIVNLCDHRGQTLLQWAASYGTPEIIELLYSKLSLNRKYDPMALTLAMLLCRMDICRTLLQHMEVVREGDVAKALIKASKLSDEDREEIQALMAAVTKRSPIESDLVPQTDAANISHKDGIIAFQQDNSSGSDTPERDEPRVIELNQSQEQSNYQVNHSQSDSLMLYIFVAELMPVLITVYYNSTIADIRRIVVHQIRQLIGVLPVKYTKDISNLKFHGRCLYQWLCELISASFAHDDGLTGEESIALLKELLHRDPHVYYNLSKQFDLVKSLEWFRNRQLFGLLKHLGAIKWGENEANLIRSSHQRCYGWSFFILGQYLTIYNEKAICILETKDCGRIFQGYIYTINTGTEIITFSDHINIKKCKGMAYRLLCMVDFVRRKYPAREILTHQEISEERIPKGWVKRRRFVSSTSKALPPTTIQIWRTKEEMIPMGKFKLDSFQSKYGKFFLRVKVCDENFFLFSEAPNYTFYYVSEHPNQVKIGEGIPLIEHFRIDESNFRVKYSLGPLITPLPHLPRISFTKRGVMRSIKNEPKLKDIAAEIFNVLLEQNEATLLVNLKNSFCKLKKRLLNTYIPVTSNEFISSEIVPALLRCLSILNIDNKSNSNDNLSDIDQLNALMRRREVFLSIFNHKQAFSKLVQCIGTAFGEIEHLPLYLFNYLHNLIPAEKEEFTIGFDTGGILSVEDCILAERGGMEPCIHFPVLRLLSHYLNARHSRDNYKLYDPLFSWNIELKMADCSELINLVIKNQYSISQTYQNHWHKPLLLWYGNSRRIQSFMESLWSVCTDKNIKLHTPYIKWLSCSGRVDSNWIDAAYRGYLPAYSLLPNCQAVYHSGVDIPLLKSPCSGACMVCKNKPGIRRQFCDVSSTPFLTNHQVGARYVIDLRAEFIATAYCLTTLRNVDTNEDIENWCLQGSNDGKNWLTLKEHNGDRSLNSEESKLFKLKPIRAGFRLFRIMDFSPIENQGRLHVCGLDFYGVVIRLYRNPLDLHELTYIPLEMEMITPSKVPQMAEFYMTNLMRSIRDNEFHASFTGYSESVYDFATGLKFGSINENEPSDKVPLVISPLSRQYNRLFGRIMSHIPDWRLQFELVFEDEDGKVLASNPIFDLKWPIFPHLVGLAEQLVSNKVSIDNINEARIFLSMRSISPEEKDQLKQEWLKKKGELLSDRDWGLVNQQKEFISSLPGHYSGRCVSKETATDMLNLIRLLYQLSELEGGFDEGEDRSYFQSQHFTRKIERQFNDNIAVMTGPAFPNWCFNLTQKMNFLFPFELRLALFRACAFGPARSINWLQDNRRDRDPNSTNNHFYSYAPYTINSMFNELHDLDFNQTYKEIHSISQKVENGEIIRDKMSLNRNWTGNDDGEEFWKWAERVLEENADNMTNLDIIYHDELGRGQGVNRDFYSTICKELRRKSNFMWLNERPSESEDFIDPAFGFFPTPYPRNRIPLTILRRFYTMGLAVGKALQEGHLMGLHLSRPFLKILCAYAKVRKYPTTENALSGIENSRNRVLSYEDIWLFGNRRSDEGTFPHWLAGVLGFEDFAELYPFHASSFRSLLQLAKIHERIRKNKKDQVMLETLLNDASVQHMKTTIENMCLTMEFTCTSSESCKNIELKDLYPWESNEPCIIDVDATGTELINNSNYIDYIRRTVEYCLNKGIQAQIDAFTRGLTKVFPLEWLSIFTTSELNHVLCGEMNDVPWKREELIEYIKKCDGCFKNSMSVFEDLVEILVSLNVEQRRSFIRWVTGYSALPSGGLKNLNPPLMIHRHETGPYPVAQTCFHLLYLPTYTTASELRCNLLTAINQDTFDKR